MNETPPVVYVDLVKDSPLRAALRPQRWRWVARNASNQKKLARCTERYTNRQDAVDAISQLFRAGTRVYLRESEKGMVLLRMAVEQ